MKKSLSFVVGAIQIVQSYALTFGETKILVNEHREWSLNSSKLDWTVT